MKKFILLIAIVCCACLVGCGNEKTQQNTGESSNLSENTTNELKNEENKSSEEMVDDFKEYAPEQYEEVKNSIDDISVSSDNNTVSFSVAEGQKAVYHHDGNKITGYEIYIQYDSAEEAILAKNTSDFTEEDDVESITVNGSTLIVKFKPEAYEDTTLEDIKQTAELINAFKGE